MSLISRISISATPPNGTGPDPAGVKVSGSSSVAFTFFGVIQGTPATVVLKTGTSMASANIDHMGDGAIVVTGGTGVIYLSLTLNGPDSQNWTVRARTDKEGAGTGTTFTGGMGGGNKPA